MSSSPNSQRRRPRAPRRGARLLAVGALLLAVAADAGAQGRRLTITNFDAAIAVNANGDLGIDERITVRFDGSWNGIYRWIPVKYRLDYGGTHRIYLDVLAVEDSRGNPLRHEIEREGALVKIKTWVPAAADTQRTVVYRYRVENAIRYFDGDSDMQWAHDELYWNVTGDEWEMPILRAQARIQLPEEATGIRAVAYTGPRGSRGDAYEQRVIGSTVFTETTRRLNLREGLTVVVGWDPGAVARPSAGERLAWTVRKYALTPLPFLAFAVMFGLWWKKGRDPKMGCSIMPRYEPPEGMRPAEVGTLMDFNVDARDLSATLIDLAVRGYLRIEEVPSRSRKRPKDHIIHILERAGDESELKDFEREMLDGLRELAEREDGALSVRVSELKREFYRHVSTIRGGIYGHLTRSPKLFTARPERVQGVWAGVAVVAGALAVAVAAAASRLDIGLAVANWASAIGVPVIVLGFGLVMPARTLRGVQLLNHVLGLREYIDRVDRDRLKYATLEHYEKLLPFAAAMGLEEKWTEAFESIITEPPRWYVSAYPGHFHAHAFSRSLSGMTAAAGTAITTAPRSASSGSGFRLQCPLPDTRCPMIEL